jgi:hypothetical protein
MKPESLTKTDDSGTAGIIQCLNKKNQNVLGEDLTFTG